MRHEIGHDAFLASATISDHGVAAPTLYRDRPRPKQRHHAIPTSANMKGRILVLGAAGRLGFVAAEAFRDAGWQVKGLVRPGRAGAVPRRVEADRGGDARRGGRGGAAAATWCSTRSIRRSPNGGRTRCRSPTRRSRRPRSNGATLLFPGSVWNYGRGMPPVLDENTPMQPTTRKGGMRVEIEQRIQRGLRPRHARHRPARRRFLRRRQRLLVRSGDRQGHRAQPPHLSRPARRRARLGLPARFRGDAGAARGAARELRAVRDLRLSRRCGDRARIHRDDRGGHQEQVHAAADELVVSQDASGS